MNGPRIAQIFDTESEQLLLGQAGPTGCSSTEVNRGSEGVCSDGSTCLSLRMIKETGFHKRPNLVAHGQTSTKHSAFLGCVSWTCSDCLPTPILWATEQRTTPAEVELARGVWGIKSAGRKANGASVQNFLIAGSLDERQECSDL